MSKAPIVTVLLPVYNAEDYLAEAIKSILAQTYTDFELLIINDGSTDSSLDIIKQFDDERIVLISRANKGLIATLNEGIEKAKGDRSRPPCLVTPNPSLIELGLKAKGK